MSHLPVQPACRNYSYLAVTTNVLDWSKLERHAEATYRPTALDIRSVCESITNLLPNIDEEANVELFLVVAPGVPSGLFLDETYIDRILMNLLSNALKFTRSGYVMLLIEVVNGKLSVIVEDTGCGLNPDFIPRMWDPYEQGEVRGTQRGTGLGLSIVKQLLQRMNGTIQVTSRFRTKDSEPSFRSGSTFTMTLPLQTTSSSPDRRRNSSFAVLPNIALLVQEEDSAYTHGLRLSWEKFGFRTHVSLDVSSLPKLEWKYVWADAAFLKNHTTQLEQLMQWTSSTILVSSNSQSTVDMLPGIEAAPHFVTLSKPLTWHLFEKRIQTAQQRPSQSAPSKTLRFAPEVEVMDVLPMEKSRPRKETPRAVILVVEDNPVSNSYRPYSSSNPS